MKNNSKNDDFNNSPENRRSTMKKVDATTNLNSKAITKVMTEQLIAPPSHIWDRIESVLDEQDSRRETGSNIIASTFRSRQGRKQKIFMAVAGITVIAGFFLIVF